MRTPALLLLDRSISELNTHFVLTDLFAREFWVTHKKLLEDSPETMTADAFFTNPAAKQINVPLSKLKSQTDEFQLFLIQQVVSRCSEVAKDYFQWIEDFSLEIFNQPRRKELNFFDGIAVQAGVTADNLADPECFLTFDHLRARRNCLVHRDAETNSAYSELRRQKGDQLNKYWTNRLSERRPTRVDFQDANPGNIGPPAFLDLLHFTRLSAETFDRNYCKLLPLPLVRTFIERRLDQQLGSSPIGERRKQQKLKRFALREFDMVLD